MLTRFFAVMSIVCVFASAQRAQASPVIKVGGPAPSFIVHGLDGSRISLGAFRGQPIFINFFATWCPPCKLELPHIVDRFGQYRSSVTFIGLDEQETPDAVKAFVKQMGMAYTIGIDEGNVAAAYLVQAIPVSIFIDRAGIVRAINRGYLTPTLLQQDLTLIAGH